MADTGSQAFAHGVTTIKSFADLGGADRQTAYNSFVAAYGQDAVQEIGAAALNLNFSILQEKLKEEIDGGADPANPTLGQINAAILAAGGVLPSIASTVASAVSDTAQEITSYLPSLSTVTIVLGVAAAAVAIIGIVYLVHSAKELKTI